MPSRSTMHGIAMAQVMKASDAPPGKSPSLFHVGSALECPGESFICDNCDRKKQLPPAPEKMVTTPASMKHAMLRIKDDKPVEIPDDDQLMRVEQRLTGVKKNVEGRLDNLEQYLTTPTATLESILTTHLQSGSAANI
ncbi:hypothetical protein H0H87_006974 [Tephrocybe sp. NHM501043]|nr:hypothetical protein H0H87_006974 [Tephrocybe sp. NHM501043]